MSDTVRETYPVAFWIAACDAATARADKQAERIRVLEEALEHTLLCFSPIPLVCDRCDAARAALKEQP